ncbi:MAG: hypothetical protein ABSC17_09165 [Thermacetogeniaceae bacterium]
MIDWNSGKHRLVADLGFVLGTSIIIFIASLLAVSALLFATGHPLSQYNFWLALLATTIAIWFLCSHYFQGKGPFVFIGVMLCLSGIFLSGVYLEGKIYDLSWDGQAYQQEGIIQLANGWNPLRDPPLRVANSIWINHYPKGPWIASASLDLLTGQIEQSKVFNPLLIVSSFCLCLSALLTCYRHRFRESLVLSLLAACNPVSIMQATTFYNDGQLSSMLVIMLALLCSMISKPKLLSALALILSMIIAINIKFTALPYLLALSLPIMLYLFLRRRMQPVRVTALSLAIGLTAGLLLVGFNPYVTNTLSNGNPFYPLAGRNAVDIMTANSPANFSALNRLGKLATSLFSRTEDAAAPLASHFKRPFTMTGEELDTIAPDTRIGGFGPLFGGAVLLSLLLIVISWPVDRKKTVFYTGLLLVILCSALVNPEAWWARYAPQVWLLPVICIMLGLAMDKSLHKAVALSIVMVLMLNLVLVSDCYFQRQYEGSQVLKGQLAEMKRAPLNLVKFRSKYSNRVRFDELGIQYQAVAKLSGPDVKPLAFSDTTYEEVRPQSAATR